MQTMERQLQRQYDVMERVVVELDTVRGSLLSVSASDDSTNQEILAGEVRHLRDNMRAVADGMDEAARMLKLRHALHALAPLDRPGPRGYHPTGPRAVSSAGRALPLQGRGRWFEPSTAHLRLRAVARHPRGASATLSRSMSEPLSFDPIAQARSQWLDRWGEEPARPMAAVTSIMRVQQILLARLGELLRPFGLTFPRYETLMVLVFSRTGALPVGKMGERLQVHRTSMTHMADRLEEAGLVTRVAHAEDRRSTLIAITPPAATSRRARPPC